MVLVVRVAHRIPGFGSSNLPSATTVVRKPRWSQTIRLDHPTRGISVTHSIFSISLHRSGRFALSPTAAFIVGPRNCPQFSFVATSGSTVKVNPETSNNLRRGVIRARLLWLPVAPIAVASRRVTTTILRRDVPAPVPDIRSLAHRLGH